MTRSVVLDVDALDRLELVLGGWLPASAVTANGTAADAVLTDAENTPLGRLGIAKDGSLQVEQLAELARGAGPSWDPDVRLTTAEVRVRIGAGRAATEVLGIVIDDLPTTADIGRVVAAAGELGVETLVVIAPVGRRARPTGGVGWAGRTRAALAVADALAEAVPGRPIIRLVLPWPSGDGPTPDLAAGGIGQQVRLTDLRGDSDRGVRNATYPPASAAELARAREAGAVGQGAVVFFTGLSGSGKSTIARALADELADAGPRRVTLLDGDEVRQHLSRGLGFDAESREINIDRIAWVASLVAAHGGIAIAAPIAPFAAGRRNARAMAEANGAFVLVWVSTPLDVCEARDRKGLYARARAGEVADFTGISSPYEPPDDADVVLDTTDLDVAEAVRLVRGALEARLAAVRADPV